MKTAIIAIILILLVGVGVYAFTSPNGFFGIGDDTGEEQIFCTLDAKLCPDGSYVGRVPPSCEFAACPGGNATSTATTTATTTRARAGSAASADLDATTTIILPRSVTVSYTQSGFSPREAIVADGGTVRFVNQSSANMWVASDPHPTHNSYPGFDQARSVPPGGSWSFVFDDEGSWGYHNHIVPTHRATVIVQ